MTTPVTLEELQTAYDILDRFTDEHGSTQIHHEETAAAIEGMNALMFKVAENRDRDNGDFYYFLSQLMAMQLINPLQDYINHKRQEN